MSLMSGRSTLPSRPLELPGVPASAEESGRVPSYAWSLTPSGSLLAQALRGDFDGDPGAFVLGDGSTVQ